MTRELHAKENLVKTSIEVKSKGEGEAIKKGLGADSVARATVVTLGVLADLSGPQQERVLRNVNEALDDAARSGEAK